MSATPQHLGKYELLQQLGRGGVGEVWKAHDLQLRRNVAVKILHNDLQSDPNFLTRFTREGQNIASLYHTNIVQIHEMNVTRPSQSNVTTAYIVMEYIEGQTLGSYLRDTAHRGIFPSVPQILYLFRCLAAAVDYAHQKNIVHGDIKPDNILLNMHDTSQFETGEPMLSDFGLPRLLGPNSTISSPAYMAPEQARGMMAVGRSDIYALGVLLYEICTGVQPFRDESSVAVMMQHINTPPSPPLLLNPGIPVQLSEVILRALTKDVTARFTSASALASAIAEACGTLNSIQGPRYPKSETSMPLMLNNPQRPRGSILGVSQPMPDPEQPFPSHTSQSLSGIHAAPSTPFSPSRALRPFLSAASQPSRPFLPAASQPLRPFLPAASQPSRPQPKIVPNSLTSSPTPSQFSQPSLPAIVQRSQPLPKLAPVSQPAAFNQFNQQHTPLLIENNVTHEQRRSTQEQPAIGIPPMSSTSMPASPPPMPPTMPEFGPRRGSVPLHIIVVAAVLLILLIGATFLAYILHTNKAGPTVTQTTSSIRLAFFQDDAQGINDQIHIDLQGIPPAPDGQVYFAWLDGTNNQSLALGSLMVQGNKASLIYQGDGKHTNLLSIIQGMSITQEDAANQPSAPSGKVVYSGKFDVNTLEHLKDILYITPNFPGSQSVAKGLLETIKSMNDKAGSIVDTLQGSHDYLQVKRQATRIIEMIDNTATAKSSGDLPDDVAPQLNLQVGLISSTDQQGYIDTLSQQIGQLKQVAGNNNKLLQHAQNVESAVTDLNDWVQKIRQDAVQIVKAANPADPTVLSTAEDLEQLATDAYTGRTIPPNQGPQPVLGSAGAYQAYLEAQYTAALDLQAI